MQFWSYDILSEVYTGQIVTNILVVPAATILLVKFSVGCDVCYIGEVIWSPSEIVSGTNSSSSLLLLRLHIRASALLLEVWGMELWEIQKCKLLQQFMVSYFSCCMYVISPFTVFLLYRLWKLKCPLIRQRTRGKGSALSHLNLNKLSRNCSNHQSNLLMARR